MFREIPIAEENKTLLMAIRTALREFTRAIWEGEIRIHGTVEIDENDKEIDETGSDKPQVASLLSVCGLKDTNADVYRSAIDFEVNEMASRLEPWLLAAKRAGNQFSSDWWIIKLNLEETVETLQSCDYHGWYFSILKRPLRKNVIDLAKIGAEEKEPCMAFSQREIEHLPVSKQKKLLRDAQKIAEIFPGKTLVLQAELSDEEKSNNHFILRLNTKLEKGRIPEGPFPYTELGAVIDWLQSSFIFLKRPTYNRGWKKHQIIHNGNVFYKPSTEQAIEITKEVLVLTARKFGISYRGFGETVQKRAVSDYKKEMAHRERSLWLSWLSRGNSKFDRPGDPIFLKKSLTPPRFEKANGPWFRSLGVWKEQCAFFTNEGYPASTAKNAADLFVTWIINVNDQNNTEVIGRYENALEEVGQTSLSTGDLYNSWLRDSNNWISDFDRAIKERRSVSSARNIADSNAAWAAATQDF